MRKTPMHGPKEGNIRSRSLSQDRHTCLIWLFYVWFTLMGFSLPKLLLMVLGEIPSPGQLITSSDAGHQYGFFVFVFAISRAAFWGIWRFPAYGSNQSCSHQPTPQPQQCGIGATSTTYITAHGNAWSLTHWARPGIEPAASWFPGGFVNHWARTGTP